MAINVRGYSEACIRSKEILERIVDAYADFDCYEDTWYHCTARPAIFWPNGKNIGYGYASHLSGDAQQFYDKFKYWGFDNLEDFYCLPVEKRNEFLKKGKAIMKATFSNEEFEKVLEDVANIEILDNDAQQQTLLSLAKAAERFQKQLAEGAREIKDECYSNCWLRWRIRNEKARFRAEDRLRERTQHLYCGSCVIEEILLRFFRLQEGIKSFVGLRERFPSRKS